MTRVSVISMITIRKVFPIYQYSMCWWLVLFLSCLYDIGLLIHRRDVVTMKICHWKL